MRLLSLLVLLEGCAAIRLAPAAARGAKARHRPAVASLQSPMPQAALAPLNVCKAAARTKAEDSDAVVQALLALEKECRAAAKTDDGALSRATLAALNGGWRLVFTTGT
ncbi:MAG: hypothetical protein SGPRY_009288, partial [Prymnesium sp.]